MTQTMMHFTNGNNEIDSVQIATAHLPIKKRYEQKFKCSFDLGSKKHRILDKQYTQGKNYVDISLLDLGDLLRRYAAGAENVKSRDERSEERNGRERRTSERDAKNRGTEETEREEETGTRRARGERSAGKEEEKQRAIVELHSSFHAGEETEESKRE
jgi:hypothetical protein